METPRMDSIAESYGQIDNVETSMVKQISARTYKRFQIFAGIAGICLVLVIFSVQTGMLLQLEFPALLILMVLTPPLCIYGFKIARIRSATESRFMEQIADSLGYAYTEFGDAATAQGRNFSVGQFPSLSQVFTGSYHSYPARFFLYRYEYPSGKSHATAFLSVFEITYSSKLPELLFGLSTHMTVPKSMEKVVLEGGFTDRTPLYVEKGGQITVRQLFEPNLMDLLQRDYAGYRLELLGNKVYILRDGKPPMDRESFTKMFTLADRLFDALAPELRNISA